MSVKSDETAEMLDERIVLHKWVNELAYDLSVVCGASVADRVFGAYKCGRYLPNAGIRLCSKCWADDLEVQP